jgi:hypothetical protein
VILARRFFSPGQGWGFPMHPIFSRKHWDSPLIHLGWETGSSTFGFDPPEDAPKTCPNTYDGDAPICVIAPTGAGKGRDFIASLAASAWNTGQTTSNCTGVRAQSNGGAFAF